MNRRIFIKSILFFISSLSLKLFSFSKNDSLISFDYGVASGDPTNSHVILWTKVTSESHKDKKINWEVSSDIAFRNIVSSGSTYAKNTNDHAVKVDAGIPAEFNGKKIFYRFRSGDNSSEIGETLTLPINNPNKFKIGFCSCSNYPAGYFNAYKELAKDEEVDLVLHLGDYIYEYNRNGYASSDAKKMGRVVNPSKEIISLDDYRKRYATYRSDADLQLLHRLKPMIAVWDDHEITNDTWKEGAQNHSKDEGPFSERRANAIKAYYEWIPIRDNEERSKIWRKFTVGNLINLLMLDTRLFGREQQLDINDYVIKRKLDKKKYKKDLLKDRDLLGNEQLEWISNNNDPSFRWTVLGQQLLIGPKYLPGIFNSEKLSGSNSYVAKQLAGEKLAFNTDQWDGYPSEREKLYEIMSKSQSNIILAGDSHNSWLSNLYNKKNTFIGIEVGAPAISSPSLVDTYKETTEIIEKLFVDENENLLWMNGRNQGYTSLTIFTDHIDLAFHYVSTVKSSNYENLGPQLFRVEHQKPLSV